MEAGYLKHEDPAFICVKSSCGVECTCWYNLQAIDARGATREEVRADA
jgi:hypothetical protein